MCFFSLWQYSRHRFSVPLYFQLGWFGFLLKVFPWWCFKAIPYLTFFFFISLFSLILLTELKLFQFVFPLARPKYSRCLFQTVFINYAILLQVAVQIYLLCLNKSFFHPLYLFTFVCLSLPLFFICVSLSLWQSPLCLSISLSLIFSLRMFQNISKWRMKTFRIIESKQ